VTAPVTENAKISDAKTGVFEHGPRCPVTENTYLLYDWDVRDAAKVHYLSQPELKRFFDAIDGKRDRAMFLTMYYHGLRASEIAMLRRDDLDLQAGTLRIQRAKRGKSGTQSLMPVETKALRSWLRSRKDASPALFPSREGNPISTEMLNVLMRKYCAVAGIPRERAHPHALLHSCGYALVESGADLRTIQRWLGHAAISSTTIYTELSDPTRDRNVRAAFGRLARLA
jgi:integrase/recombinase XerD